MTLPDLAWLNTIPVIGAKLYAGWHNLLDMGGTAIMAKVRPYIGTTTTWFVGQAAHIGRFMVAGKVAGIYFSVICVATVIFCGDGFPEIKRNNNSQLC